LVDQGGHLLHNKSLRPNGCGDVVHWDVFRQCNGLAVPSIGGWDL
jgi:hypothetical protein